MLSGPLAVPPFLASLTLLSCLPGYWILKGSVLGSPLHHKLPRAAFPTPSFNSHLHDDFNLFAECLQRLMLSILHILSLVLPNLTRWDSDFFLTTEESNMHIAWTSGLPQFSTTSKRQSQNSSSAGLLHSLSKPPGYTTSNNGIFSPNPLLDSRPL